jgi:hypothetical protein
MTRSNLMIERSWILTLTLLGRSPETCTLGRAKLSSRTEYARRAMLVIRAGHDHGRLRQRLIDSISRLACGPVAGASSVADLILADLFDHRTPWRDRSRWTLVRVEGDRLADPYECGSTRLVLVDPPVEAGRVKARRSKPAHKPVLADSGHRVCMS